MKPRKREIAMKTRKNLTQTIFAVVALTLNFLFAEAFEVPFDTTTVNETASQTVIFSNTGDLPLVISDFRLNSNVFAMSSDSVMTVEAGEEVEITIEFTPKNEGVHNATMTFTTNDPENENVEMTLLGTATASVSIDDEFNNLPETFELGQNYPNPFNPSTTVKYQVPENAKVNIVVYNMTGQKVTTLTNEFKTAGYHTVNWDGTNDFGQKVSSGVYFLRMQADAFAKTISMTFTK